MISIWEMKDIVTWAAYGMSLPNMLRYGAEVKFTRWHGNYIRCMVVMKMPWGLYLGSSPPFFAPGRIVAAAEFVGNTLKQQKTLVIFSEFEAEDCSMWSDGTIAFKRRSNVDYKAYVEIRKWNGEVEISRSFDMEMEDVFRLAETALDHVSGEVKNQLKLFFENFYFLPRRKEEFEHYYRIEEFDCIWYEDVSYDPLF